MSSAGMAAPPRATAANTWSEGRSTAGAGGRRRGPAGALLAANAVSLAGNQMSALAIPWFVLVTTGSAAKTGLVGFCSLVPAILAALVGGAVVDRLGPKRTSVLSDLASGSTVAAIPLLHAADALSFEALLALVFLGALLDAPGATARDALYPDLIALGGLRAERANALYGAVGRAAMLLGPVLAGLLVAATGATAVLWVDAATFAVSALVIGLGVPGRRSVAGVPPAEQQGAIGGYVRQLREGFAFLWRDRLLRTLALTVGLTNLIEAPLAVALPVYAKDELGNPESLGLLLGAFGGGALAGSLIFGAIGHRLPRRATYVAAFAAVALPFWVLALTPPLPAAMAAALVVGVAAGPINPILTTVRQERVPPELRGRVFGTFRALAWCAMPLGVLAGGFAIEAVGVGATFGAIAACYLLATLALVLNPALRAMDRPRAIV